MIKLKVYLAGGWFSENQDRVLTQIEEILSNYNCFKVYSPRRQTQFKSGTKPSKEICEIVFNNNIVAIEDCDIMIASTEEKDMGTVFEMGIAFQLEKPIIAVYFHKEPYNLMLEEASSGVARNTEQLCQILDIIDVLGLERYLKEEVSKYRYQGLIE